MRFRTVLIGFGLFALAYGLGVYTGMAGAPEPPGPPGSTLSFTLEDIYNRLDTGAAGAQSSFTEPASSPGTGTMHALNDIMAVAPAADDAAGALPAEVLAGKTYWGLRTDGTWGAQAGTRAPAPVPKTWQTRCYLSADPWGFCTCGDPDCPGGQDGALQTGVAWPDPRFTDNGDGTVTDNLTGLIWLQNVDCPAATRDWATAFLDVAQLNADGTMNGQDCGDTSDGGSHQTDWRLPNIRELHSLVDYSRYHPALPGGHPFSGDPSTWYWSSTTVASSTKYAWYVNINNGIVDNYYKTSTLYYRVWPVRGGQ